MAWRVHAAVRSRGEGALWRPLRPVKGVVQRFPGCFWGVGDAGGGLQAVPSAWWGRDLVVGGVCRCPSDLAVVVPFHCPADVPVFEDVDLCGGRGGVHGVPAEDLDGANLGWMSSAVGPVLGASCAAWASGGEGRSSQRREADAAVYMAAIRTCSISHYTMSWFSPFRSRCMVASAFQGEECDGAFRSGRGMRRLIWRASVRWGVGGAFLEGGWSHRRVLDKV